MPPNAVGVHLVRACPCRVTARSPGQARRGDDRIVSRYKVRSRPPPARRRAAVSGARACLTLWRHDGLSSACHRKGRCGLRPVASWAGTLLARAMRRLPPSKPHPAWCWRRRRAGAPEYDDGLRHHLRIEMALAAGAWVGRWAPDSEHCARRGGRDRPTSPAPCLMRTVAGAGLISVKAALLAEPAPSPRGGCVVDLWTASPSAPRQAAAAAAHRGSGQAVAANGRAVDGWA